MSGLAYQRNRQPVEAVSCLQRVLRDQPDSQQVLELLAAAYIERGSFVTALKVRCQPKKINKKLRQRNNWSNVKLLRVEILALKEKGERNVLV